MSMNNIAENVIDEIRQMIKAGVIYGHKKSKTYPKFKPYLAGRHDEIELISPEATMESLQKAVDFLKEKITNNGLVLVVGTLPSAYEAIKNLTDKFNWPCVINRWLGGTLTNFKVISDRIKYYQELKSKKESGELSKYTKKEQQKFNEQIIKLSKLFDGILNLSRAPDVLFVIDIKEHRTAVREAKRLKIPVIALVDSDDDPTLVDYPVFSNDHSKQAIEWVVNKMISLCGEPTEPLLEN